MKPNQQNNRKSRKWLGISCWVWGFLLAVLAIFLSNYVMCIGGNYTTIWYVTKGCVSDSEGNVIGWNPPEPLDDALLPTVQNAQRYNTWLKSTSPINYVTLRDHVLFCPAFYLSMGIPILLGRIDIMWWSIIIHGCLTVFKACIALTFQTPHAAGKCLAMEELKISDRVDGPCHGPLQRWRDPDLFWNNLFKPGFCHVADMVYSGHTFNILIWIYASLLSVYQSRLKYRVRVLGFLGLYYTVILLAFFAIGFATRMHYSFDVLMAAILWMLLAQIPRIWRAALLIANYFAPPEMEGGPFSTMSIEDIKGWARRNDWFEGGRFSTPSIEDIKGWGTKTDDRPQDLV